MTSARSGWTLLALMIVSGPLEVRAGSPVYAAPYTFTIASAACPTGTSPGPGNGWGISLAGLRGFKATLCPADGQTITGLAGAIKVCVYSAAPWGPGKWALSELKWTMTTADATTTDNPCRELYQLQTVVGLSDRVFVYPSTDFGVSGGSTLTVYLVGETR